MTVSLKSFIFWIEKHPNVSIIPSGHASVPHKGGAQEESWSEAGTVPLWAPPTWPAPYPVSWWCRHSPADANSHTAERKTKLMDSAKMSSCLFVDIFSFLMFYNQQQQPCVRSPVCAALCAQQCVCSSVCAQQCAAANALALVLILNSRTASSTKAKKRVCSVGAELWLSTVL